MATNLYLFYGNRDHYRHKPANVVSIGFKNDKDYTFVTNGSYTDKLGIIISKAIPTLVEELNKLELEDKRLTILSARTIKEQAADVQLVLNLIMTTTEAEEVKRRIIAMNLSDESRDQLLAVEAAVRQLKDNGFTFNLKEDKEPSKDELKDIGTALYKEQVAGILETDAAAMRTFTRLHSGGEALMVDTVKDADKRKKTKEDSTLLVDNLVFDWGERTLDGLSVYYSGNGDLENKKPKGEKNDPVGSKAFVYFSGNNRRLRVLGKVDAEDRYNVTILKKPFEYMNKVFELQDKVCSEIHSIRKMAVFRKDVIMSAGVSNFIEQDNFNNLANSDQGDIYTTSTPRKDLSYVFNPPRLAFKIKRELEYSRDKLISVIKGDYSKFGIKLTDITDQLFDTTDKDKLTFNSAINSDAKIIKLQNIMLSDLKEVVLKLVFKADIPELKYFKKMFKLHPKVEVATWDVDENTVAYAVVVTNDEGWLWYHSSYGGRYVRRSASKKGRG